MVAAVDDAVSVGIAVSDVELNGDVGEEGDLAGDVEKKEAFWKSSEESELQRSEEGRIDCP